MASEEKGLVSKRSQAPKIAQRENGAVEKTAMAAAGAGVLRQWQQQSSRIFRVSRASGGKDRHSKVFTSKGLRDRRVRLSVSTAIQFYDLQDRLGYDQPSKAIEWLIQAASAAIDELPLLGNSFLHLPPEDDGQKKQVNSEADHNPPQLSISKSGCSSNSETSKGSVLSLSKSDIRVKKRKRASPKQADEINQSLMNTRSSFTELLTDEASGAQIQNFPPATADYFGQDGFFTRAAPATQKLPYYFSSPQAHSLNGSPQVGMVPFNIADGYQSEMQQLPFMQGYMDYNLNFSMAAGLAGFQRGTLQSNSTAQLTQQLQQQHLLRFSSSMDGPNSTENYLHSGFDSRLQLSREPTTPFFLDGYKHSDVDKGKGKS